MIISSFLFRVPKESEILTSILITSQWVKDSEKNRNPQMDCATLPKSLPSKDPVAMSKLSGHWGIGERNEVVEPQCCGVWAPQGGIYKMGQVCFVILKAFKMFKLVQSHANSHATKQINFFTQLLRWILQTVLETFTARAPLPAVPDSTLCCETSW